MRFCVVGLGYVGLTLAVHLVKRGFQVDGVDVSDAVLEALSRGRAHFYEEGFDNEVNVALSSGRFRFSREIQRANAETFFVVTVGTPMAKNGRVNLDTIKHVIGNIASVLHDGDTVILRSTVKVGVTRNVIKPLLDQSQRNYFLGYCPERTIEGKALLELADLPQIVSGIDAESTRKANEVFSQFSHETVVMNSVEEAEMVKLLNNSERDLMFAIANEIALMCDAKGLDAHRIISAANFRYPRSNLRKPGPVGGPCLEKDPYILTEGFLDDGYVPKLFLLGRRINESLIGETFRAFAEIFVQRLKRVPQKVTILGIAFKGVPPTGDVRGSLVYVLVDSIRKRFPSAEIAGHDYLASTEDIVSAGCIPEIDVTSAVTGADMVILQNNHPNYAHEKWTEILAQDALILDFWNQLDGVGHAEIGNNRYFRFGALHANSLQCDPH